ncbi:flagellar motor stator protein MotA [Chromobacterium sp. ATCC 53434]|uniref:flagellar motor stator protein MotA n=1 Tax=Chromobacterium TaxID=535 RepID=UPI000C7682E4|nr:flagellar motor stator protein MotA [Chromobacterium sp. ATCC 53434]AUH50877.1 flagellar motor stator protein MotA [Chromobacterium sp. ATCC 53434]
MFVAIGYILILASVLGGFVAAGGELAALMQPLEVVMIVGAALGAFVVANGGAPLKATMKAMPTVFKGSPYSKAFYMDLFSLLFEILTKVRKEGLMSIEADVENPEASPVFSKYPTVLHDHHIVEFVCDYLRLMVGGNLNAFEIENLMDVEIDTHHHEGEVPVNAVKGLADGMPAFGIVAAVMGVVHTMASVGAPPAELGMLIAHALVGTFLGILLAYGFVGPLATILEHKLGDGTRVYQTIKVTLLASLNGYAPQVAVEFGRKALTSTDRPSFKELEDHVKQKK